MPSTRSSNNEIAALREEVAALRAQIAAMHAPAAPAAPAAPLSEPFALLHAIGEDIYALQSASDWTGSSFSAINQLKPDHSGKVGELFVKRLCDSQALTCVYDEDINDQDDGTYDVFIGDKRVEIKTARLGVQRGFQHESLRAEGCDYYLFLDITRDCFYVTIVEKFDMTQRHPILGRKPHLRKGATDVYKLDFTEPNLTRGIAAGITLKVTAEVTMTQITDFITQQIV